MTNDHLPSSSGARITGDDIQHAVAWHSALRSQVPLAGVRGITVEARNAGNVDDVVVFRATDSDEYTQVKAVVTARDPLNIGWLMQRPDTTRGRSILQRFFDARTELRRESGYPLLRLVTNRSIDPACPVMTLRDSTDRLTNRLRYATDRQTATKRAELLEHLGCGEEEMFEFLGGVLFRVDASEAVWAEQIRDISYAAGVRADDTAARLGISEVRNWVKTTRTMKNADDIAEVIERLGLRVQDPFTVLNINALEAGATALDAAVTLNWVPRLRGTSDRTRRGLLVPADWQDVLWPELQTSRQRLRSLGARRVLVSGSMRLPAWFAVGATYMETTGFTPAKVCDGELWAKPSNLPVPAPITSSPDATTLPAGQDVALVLAISTDPTEDVRQYLAASGRTMPVMVIGLGDDQPRLRIKDGIHAYAVALAIRDQVRHLARAVRPPTLHLFMACPAGLALLLGSLWDRVPTTQTYEDLNGLGYEPAFRIEN